jgi:hypothetical protein
MEGARPKQLGAPNKEAQRKEGLQHQERRASIINKVHAEKEPQGDSAEPKQDCANTIGSQDTTQEKMQRSAADSKEREEGSNTEMTPPTRRELQESIQNADKATQAMTIPLPPSRSPFPAPTLSLLSPVGPMATQSTLWSCPAALAARS